LPFVCSFCGEHHDEELLDMRARFPDAVFELSDEQRGDRVDAGDDACVLDGGSGGARYFVRGLLELPIHDLDESFAYGTWVEVDQSAFHRIGVLWRDPRASEEPPFSGFLANELEPYEGTSGLPAELKLEDVEHVPSIRVLEPTHPLHEDQALGITGRRAHELLSVLA
jgi:hypothetical protein